MTTITIHLGEVQDGAAGNTGIASGGRNPTPTACLILYPSTSTEEVSCPVQCIYSGSDAKSVKTAETLSKSINAPVEYKTSALNSWDLGHMKEDSESTLLMRLPPYLDLTPEAQVSGGESFNEYKKRALGEIEDLSKELESGKSISIVCDPMTVKLAAAWFEEKAEKEERGEKDKFYVIDSDIFLKDGFKNVSAKKIYKEDGEWDVDDLSDSEGESDNDDESEEEKE